VSKKSEAKAKLVEIQTRLATTTSDPKWWNDGLAELSALVEAIPDGEAEGLFIGNAVNKVSFNLDRLALINSKPWWYYHMGVMTVLYSQIVGGDNGETPPADLVQRAKDCTAAFIEGAWVKPTSEEGTEPAPN